MAEVAFFTGLMLIKVLVAQAKSSNKKGPKLREIRLKHDLVAAKLREITLRREAEIRESLQRDLEDENLRESRQRDLEDAKLWEIILQRALEEAKQREKTLQHALEEENRHPSEKHELKAEKLREIGLQHVLVEAKLREIGLQRVLVEANLRESQKRELEEANLRESQKRELEEAKLREIRLRGELEEANLKEIRLQRDLEEAKLRAAEMDADQARELAALEAILNDRTKDPIKLSYGLLKFITDDFSNERGRGGFGAVYQGYFRNAVVAVKKILNVHNYSNTQFMDEVKCLTSANHTNIVRFLGYCADSEEEIVQSEGRSVMTALPKRMFCFEYVPQGNIRQYLQQEKPNADDWLARYKMIRGIIQGLHHLHEKKITHLDLKPENIMLDADMEPKITDFGSSRFLDQGESTITTENLIGTRRYIAPEAIDNGQISFMSDMYALGIIIIELLTGVSKISLDEWDKSSHIADCPRARMCREIAIKCTDVDRNKRPTINEVIRVLGDLEKTIPQFSENQATGSAFPGTEMVDVYPLELKIPFVPNQEMYCHLSVTNKTDGVVLCCIGSDGQEDRNQCLFEDLLPPMSTTAITFGMYAEEELPSDTYTLEILMIITGCDHDVAEQKMAAADDLEELLELPGFELHSAMLTAVVVSEDDDRALMVDAAGQGGESYIDVELMDVHPTEPWVLILTDSGDLVYIWNMETKECIGAYGRPDVPIGQEVRPDNMLAKFIPQNQWLVIGNSSGSILVRTSPAMDQITQFEAHHGGVTSLAVHPTRPFLLSCCYSPMSLKLWDWNQDWSCIRTFEITKPVRQLMFNPKDARTFATCDDDHFVKMWRIGHPDPVATTHPLERYGRSDFFTYSGAQHFIATVHRDATCIWDLPNGKHVHTIHIAETEQWISAVVCHPARPVLVTASMDGSIRVWDSITYRLKKTYLKGPKDPKYIGFTGSRRLVIGYREGISVMDIDLE